MMNTLGPRMEEALRYIRRNPGCSLLDVCRAITRSEDASPTGHGQPDVVARLMRSGLVYTRQERPCTRHYLYAVDVDRITADNGYAEDAIRTWRMEDRG